MISQHNQAGDRTESCQREAPVIEQTTDSTQQRDQGKGPDTTESHLTRLTSPVPLGSHKEPDRQSLPKSPEYF